MDFVKSLSCCCGSNEEQSSTSSCSCDSAEQTPPSPPVFLRCRINRVDRLANYEGAGLGSQNSLILDSYYSRNGGDLDIPDIWMTPSRTVIGDPVTFHAYFKLSDLQNYTIVWSVGMYSDIRESDTKFVLQNDKNTQSLYIIAVDVNMYGRVECEVRQWDPLRKKYHIRRGKSSLVVLARELRQLESIDEDDYV